MLPGVELITISGENVDEVCKLKAKPEQNCNELDVMKCLAWTHHSMFWLRAIKSGDLIVGMLGVSLDPQDDRSPLLSILLIDVTYQCKGFGKAVMNGLLAEFSKLYRFLTVKIPAGVEGFFERFGFHRLSECEGSIRMIKTFSDTPALRRVCPQRAVLFKPIDALNFKQVLEIELPHDSIITPIRVARQFFAGGYFFHWERAIYCDETLVGYVVLNLEPQDGDTPFLNHIVIDKKYQTQGIGSAVIVELFNLLSRFCKRLTVSTSATLGAIGFYDKFGFKHIGTRPNGGLLLVKEFEP